MFGKRSKLSKGELPKPIFDNKAPEGYFDRKPIAYDVPYISSTHDLNYRSNLYFDENGNVRYRKQ